VVFLTLMREWCVGVCWGIWGGIDWCRSRESARTLPRERAAVKICYVVGM
jgi:hypothetical protein